MNRFHRIVAAGTVAVVGLCGLARGQQVLEQTPSDAAVVFEVKDLQGLSTKLAKFAKTLGIDQFQPQWGDPLGAMQTEFDIKQGLNKNGDMAIAVFMPEKQAGHAKAGEADKPGDAESQERKEEAAGRAAHEDEGEPSVVVLLPTSDYKSFLGNFADEKDAGAGISEVTVQKNHEKLFIVKRGAYAEAAMDKALLAKPVGFKMQGPAAAQVSTKDAIVYVDMKSVRPEMKKGIKQIRDEVDKEANNPNAAKNNPMAAQMNPQMMQMMKAYFALADQFIDDSRSAAFTLNMTPFGISAGAIGDFEPESKFGKLVAMIQNTDQPLLAGLPKATYFGFGGMKLSPEATGALYSDVLEPLLAVYKGQADNEAWSKVLDAMKEQLTATKSAAFGYVAGTGAPGAGLFSVVAVMHGDAQKILQSQKTVLPQMSAFMGAAGGKNTIDVQMGAPETVDGVNLETYTMKFHFDPNNPASAQAQQMISMMFGRNGVTGELGAVNPDTYVAVQGKNEQLLADLIASAKANSDPLDGMANVKKVAGELPKQRAVEGYIAIDNIANMAVKIAKQQGLPIQFKLPPDLPPVGFSMGTEGSAATGEMVIPTQLIQSITAAVMQAFMQNNNAPGQGGGGI